MVPFFVSAVLALTAPSGFMDDATGPTPGTFAVVLNEKLAAIGKILPTRTTSITNIRRQPR